MAKDYFQDITPPATAGERKKQASTPSPTQPPPLPAPPISTIPPAPSSALPPEPAERSIRNIPINTTRPRVRIEDMRDTNSTQTSSRKHGSRMWLWGGVVVALLALAALALIAMRPTTVSVVPRSHAIHFDETARFTAYPSSLASEGTLAFTLESTTLEDSQVVSASGSERVEERASGTVTVFNDYSTDSVTLIKNTRFESPKGLIFKVPAEVVVPGKKGSVPGQIDITVIAESPGEKYNIAASSFTLPGLKPSADMFSKVTARSSLAMTGGFVGERPAIAASLEEATRAEIRDRLEQKARDSIDAKESETTMAFPELARISYETLPPTSEAGGGIRMHERARIEIPLFPRDQITHVIARSVSADAEGGELILKPGNDLRALRATPEEVPLTESLDFALEGSAQLIWKVDATALASALAGKDETAFQSIVQGFPPIEEAHARIEPFWKNSFPSDPAAIRITVEKPASI